MNFLQRFIERPILATVLSILIVLLGIVGMLSLPITRFPDIAPPSVNVSLSYPGANSETVAKAVLLPVEEAINGVEGMTYINSRASNSGSGSITVYFEVGMDPDLAAVNVQNRLSVAMNQIPSEVVQQGITTTKRQAGNMMTIDIFSKDTLFDETFLQAYAKNNIIREILRVQGVAQANLLGSRDYSMRTWLLPEKLASYGLTPQDVIDAIKDQSFEIAPGSFGENSDEMFETILKYRGRFNLPKEYENIVIRSNSDGSVLYLRDVARVEFGASNYGSDNKVNGYPGVTINIQQTNGSNAREIDIAIRKILERAKEDFPEGVFYNVSYSVREQIDASISQVKHTLVEAFILVFIIVFIFLQDFRSTLIPAIAIPVSLLGTFFFLKLMGFSINVLTMFALVLVIGIVVDDAIVVVEAVHHKMQHTKLSPLKASIATMKEITGAILSITMVMTAVFLPVGFMTGPVGMFYQQFSYTLAFAILISAFNALTLSPALCALILRNENKKQDDAYQRVPHRTTFFQRFKTSFNTGFEKYTEKYIRAVGSLIKYRWLSLAGLGIVILLTVLLMRSVDKSFIPTEDDSFVTYSLAMPPGASLTRTTEAVRKADNILKQHPAVASVTSVSGYNVLTSSRSSAFATGYINLKPYSERGKTKNINKIMGQIEHDLSIIKEGKFSVFTRPTIQGFGDFSGVQFVIQDRNAGDFVKFGSVAESLIDDLNSRPEIGKAFTPFKTNFPQYQVEVDYLRAKHLGVKIKDLMNTVRAYFGRVQAGDFNRFGRHYRVYMSADIEYRSEPSDLKNIFVKNSSGEMVPVSAVVTLKKAFGPETVSRFNLFNSIIVNVVPASGYSTGKVMQLIDEIAKEKLPRGFSYEWTGMSREESQSSSQTTLIFILSILFVYFLLAAQYESYILPFAVLLSIPTGLFGIFATIKTVGINNNIYVQVALIMLIGLLAKNAILIIEYAVQRRRNGMSIIEAAVEASRLRLRPIVMTSFAFIAGLIPLMWTVGPSAIGNKSISISAAGGMLFGVMMGIFIIPVLYVIFQTWHEAIRDRLKQPEDELDEE